MTNPPFGFGLPPSDDSGDRPDNPGGVPGGFDMSQLGAMLSQLGAMMSASGPSTGPVNYDLARKMAVQQLGAMHPASSVDIAAARDAVALAEVWLDGATTFPVGATSTTAWTPAEWIDKTMPTWERLVSPVADRMSAATVEGLPEEVRSQVGPMIGMLTSMGGMAFGSQLGAALSQLAKEVLTSTDIGLPLGPDRTAALLPTSIATLSTSLGIDADQVRLYLAVREAAHHRLFHGVPWLKDKIVSLVGEYASHTTIDMSAAEELMSSFDPTNMAALQESLGSGMLSPEPTSVQQAIARRLEALLALVEGWVDAVVSGAVGDRLPTAAGLAETLRRRRATGGPAEATFATLLGVELRPRQLRAAAQLWRDLAETRGMDGRDAMWSDYDLLPTADDLESPDDFVARDKQFSELLAGLDDLTVADFEDKPTDPADKADDDKADDGEGEDRPKAE